MAAIELDRIGKFDTWPDAALAAQKRIVDLEAALREIEQEAEKANADGGDELLVLIAGNARAAWRKQPQTEG